MMPLLFALGQHAALRAVQCNKSLFAFHDDVHVATTPDRVGEVYTALATQLYTHSRIRLHGGKTQVWNAAGLRPTACDFFERIAQAEVWRGSDLPTREQGIRVLGTLLGHEDIVIAQLDALLDQHQVLLSRIPLIADVQSAVAPPLRRRSRELHLEGDQTRDGCTLRNWAQQRPLAVFVHDPPSRSASGSVCAGPGYFALVHGRMWVARCIAYEQTRILG